MSQGTVKMTPKAGKPGSLTVTVADPNRYNVRDGSTLNFEDPGFPIQDGNTADCDITSETTCNVIRIVELAS